ncbi:LysR family transcriptional regulator [Brevibacillus humidisoli]|uniref:LysR family transcriptional regulator n=1 Tax=Brevibacillus humidisoli TaxID=2895522 RepID=UPI001E46BCDD|nr:LysR family transcriptional regulator [Brevibacillus humidisoli]UFJ40763.1 LysR family transcriptional regulator [Brevibacillus humidisoli]
MNLYALSIFTSVASKGSYTRAAEELNLTQPAISAQIKKLEQEVGLRLFTPHGRGIQLTEAGRFLFQSARRLFAYEKEMEYQLAKWKSGQIGSLRIAASNLPANRLVPLLMGTCKQRFPEVEVKLHSTNSTNAIELLQDFQVDVAITGGESRGSRTDQWCLYREELWFIVHANHPKSNQIVSLQELLQEPFVVREKGSTTREALASLCRLHQLPFPDIGMEFSGTNEGIQAVLSGYGAMLAPSLMVQDEIARKRLGRVWIEGVDVQVPIYLHVRKGEEMSPVVQQFTHFCLNEDIAKLVAPSR